MGNKQAARLAELFTPKSPYLPLFLSPTMPTEGQKFFQGDSFARSILANDPTLHMHTVFLNSV